MRRGLSLAAAGVACLWGSAVHADVEYVVRYLGPEIDGSGGANQCRTLAAAARMGHYAWTGTTPPSEAPLVSGCIDETRRLSGGTTSGWPEACNPAGMASALKIYSNNNWALTTYPSSSLQTALNEQLAHLMSPVRSPNVVPIYGHADHWAINHRIWTDSVTGEVLEYDIYDAGPMYINGSRASDGSRTSYANGEVTIDPTTWSLIYYRVINTVPTTDPYYGRYLTFWEPPPGGETPQATFRARLPQSPLRQGESGDRITGPLVRDRALESLRLAGLTRNPDMWAVFVNSTPTLPFEVSGMYPNGSHWDYFLVPFLNKDHLMVGMALLSRDELRYQMAWIPSEPQPFRGYSHAEARQIAQASLRPGEALGEGLLTWDPAAAGDHARSPMIPYYEFKLYSGGQRVGAVAVQFHSGHVYDIAADQESRRMKR
jgi:hypothetical protein